jgi:hypothetical protein
MSKSMKSPFPGMDPFLEDPGFWPDFHSTFIHSWREHIAERLPDHYHASIGERSYLLEEWPEQAKLAGPDVAVTHARGLKGPRQKRNSGAATLEPVTIPVTVLDAPRELYIEILHQPDRVLVAVLEMLSPGNKEEPGRGAYLAKRNALFYQNVHMVELDLLLKGQRLPLAKPLPTADYYYLVGHAARRPDCDVYYWNLQDPLPTLPLPLLAGDPDILCDLEEVFSTAFKRGRYRPLLRYGKPLPARMSAAKVKWIKETLGAAKA